ncbi:hypothetical protein [Cellulomonas sp. URHE0023]|uniref:hypothetical protein n=1 Tax=Cellulomonas sp. URHE0023 TaxID=1380354 RepID=UPI0004834FAB|nr:hypothetical protein [Cellulomonas sp. URHE0023]
MIRAVVVWALLLAALVAGAAVVLLPALWSHVDAVSNQFAARGVLVLTMALVGFGSLFVLGARDLWRWGRPGRLRWAFGIVVAVSVWGAIASWVEREPSSAVVAVVVWGAGAGPLVLLRTPSARRWVSAVPRSPHPRIETRWAGRLGPEAAQHLARFSRAVVVAIVFAVMVPTALGFAGADGAPVGLAVAAVAVIGLVLSGVLARLSLRAARDAVAAQHGLPRGSCRWVVLTSPSAFDATLARAIRLSSGTG